MKEDLNEWNNISSWQISYQDDTLQIDLEIQHNPSYIFAKMTS